MARFPSPITDRIPNFAGAEQAAARGGGAAGVPERGDDSIREVIHGNDRIVYRLRRDVIEIATVFHGARLFRLD